MRGSSTAAHKCSTAWGRPLLSGNWAKPHHDACSFCLDSSSWTYCALGVPRLYCANVLWKPRTWYWFVHNNTAAAVWQYSKTLLVHTHFKCTNTVAMNHQLCLIYLLTTYAVVVLPVPTTLCILWLLFVACMLTVPLKSWCGQRQNVLQISLPHLR